MHQLSKSLLFAFAMTCPLTMQAQNEYTVELPENYYNPYMTVAVDLSEDEVVLGATLAPSKESLLFFDTTDVFNLNEIYAFYQHIPYLSDEEIAQRIAAIDTEMPLNFNEHVRTFIDAFGVRKRDYITRMLEKQHMYFGIFDRINQQYNIPEQIKYLAIVESALNPKALSRAGALGVWQFMPLTGKMFGLISDKIIDERMDPEKSTEAAVRYLRDLYNKFGDWELALAAYNCGPGNVRKALTASGKSTFWEIYDYLPKETRAYVPQFVAFTYLMTYAEAHHIFPNEVKYEIPTVTVSITSYVNLEELAKQLNVCYEDFMMINAHIKTNYIPATAKGYEVKIPQNRLAYFEANQDQVLLAANTKVSKTFNTYTNPKITTTPSTTASAQKPTSKSTATASASTKPVAPANANTSVGSKLLTPYNNLQNSVPKYHVVKYGDNLWDISRKYEGMTVQKIRELNNIEGNKIKIGQKLRVG